MGVIWPFAKQRRPDRRYATLIRAEQHKRLEIQERTQTCDSYKFHTDTRGLFPHWPSQNAPTFVIEGPAGGVPISSRLRRTNIRTTLRSPGSNRLRVNPHQVFTKKTGIRLNKREQLLSLVVEGAISPKTGGADAVRVVACVVDPRRSR
jgi:hypothetical protein